jgi:hypothetical protein
MFREIHSILLPEELDALHQIADTAPFVDGRISNPHSTVKNNLQLHDQSAAQRSAKIMTDALLRNEDFRNFVFPRFIAPPMITKYSDGMHYGMHHDAAFMSLGQRTIRSDISCTIFLSDPASYGGGPAYQAASGRGDPLPVEFAARSAAGHAWRAAGGAELHAKSHRRFREARMALRTERSRRA